MRAKTFFLPAVAALALGATPALAEHSDREHETMQGPSEHACGCGARHGAPSAQRAAEGTLQNGVRTFQIAVTENGFEPARVKAARGEKVRLLFTRETDRTCAKEVVIGDQGIERPLPLHQAVAVELRPSKPGEIRYACGMGHVSGVVLVH